MAFDWPPLKAIGMHKDVSPPELGDLKLSVDGSSGGNWRPSGVFGFWLGVVHVWRFGVCVWVGWGVLQIVFVMDDQGATLSFKYSKNLDNKRGPTSPLLTPTWSGASSGRFEECYCLD